MDKEILILIGFLCLVFLFILPSWHDIGTELTINSVTRVNQTITFNINYKVPWQKECYIVIYGPFDMDKTGHEVGNNIEVLTKRSGTFIDSLLLQQNQNLDSLRVELWCDNKKLLESESQFS